MYTEIRWKQRFQNYQKAFLALLESKNALSQDSQNKFIQDSLIQRYEFTFELAWKTMKDYLENAGFKEITSPRSVIRQAFQSNLIEDGELWLKAMDDRNKTSHIYNERIAKEITEDILNKYLPLLESLYNFFHKDAN